MVRSDPERPELFSAVPRERKGTCAPHGTAPCRRRPARRSRAVIPFPPAFAAPNSRASTGVILNHQDERSAAFGGRSRSAYAPAVGHPPPLSHSPLRKETNWVAGVLLHRGYERGSHGGNREPNEPGGKGEGRNADSDVCVAGGAWSGYWVAP